MSFKEKMKEELERRKKNMEVPTGTEMEPQPEPKLVSEPKPPKTKTIKVPTRTEIGTQSELCPKHLHAEFEGFENRLIELRMTIADLTKRIGGLERHKVDSPLMDTRLISDDRINAFIIWVMKLNPDDYPGQSQLLRQTQKYGKKAQYADVLQLLRMWIETLSH
jgi:hypothetical protein